MDNKKKYASHLEVREELAKMQRNGGAMIQPFILNKVIKLAYIGDSNDKSLDSFIRDCAYVFCALCNEYYIFYCYKKYPSVEFYISSARWNKYFIDKETRTKCIDTLESIGLISTERKLIPRLECEARVYKVDFDKLILYRRAAEELYEKEQIKRDFF